MLDSGEEDLAKSVALMDETVRALYEYVEGDSGVKLPRPIPVLKLGLFPRFYLGAMENWGLIMTRFVGLHFI